MEEKGLFGCLFDFSFSAFVTTRLIKALYILSIIMSCFMGLSVIVTGISSRSVMAGVLSFIIGPIVALLSILMTRIWLELVIVAFRIAENTARLVELQSPEGDAETAGEPGEGA